MYRHDVGQKMTYLVALFRGGRIATYSIEFNHTEVEPFKGTLSRLDFAGTKQKQAGTMHLHYLNSVWDFFPVKFSILGGEPFVITRKIEEVRDKMLEDDSIWLIVSYYTLILVSYFNLFTAMLFNLLVVVVLRLLCKIY